VLASGAAESNGVGANVRAVARDASTFGQASLLMGHDALNMWEMRRQAGAGAWLLACIRYFLQ
jgi:hypothetical protein